MAVPLGQQGLRVAQLMPDPWSSKGLGVAQLMPDFASWRLLLQAPCGMYQAKVRQYMPFGH